MLIKLTDSFQVPIGIRFLFHSGLSILPHHFLSLLFNNNRNFKYKGLNFSDSVFSIWVKLQFWAEAQQCVTRWYPCGIQRLVSTYSNCHWRGHSVLEVKSQRTKICLNFNFGGGGSLLELKSESAKICLTFNFREGGVVNQIPEQSVVRNLSTNFAFASQIVTDSLSHTTYVETNKKSLNIEAAVCETQSFPMLHFQFAEVSYLKVTTIKDVFREDVPGTQMCWILHFYTSLESEQGNTSTLKPREPAWSVI